MLYTKYNEIIYFNLFTGEFSGLVSKSITCRCLTKRLVSYHLGQAGPVTLHHIESLLLDNYAHVYSTLVDQTTGLCDTEPLENPLVDWNVTRDPRTVFALANAYALSPCIEVSKRWMCHWVSTHYQHQLEMEAQLPRNY